MKRKILLFSFVAFFAFVNAHAQISKGSIFLGGQVQFLSQSSSNSQSNINTPKSTVFNFSPSIGKAIKDNTVVGIDLNYTYSKTNEDNYPANSTNNTFGAGIFMRRYVPLGKGFYVFGQGTFGGSYGSGTTDTSQVISNYYYFDTKGYSFGLTFYPGISYQVSKRLQLETGFNNLAYIDFRHSKYYQSDGNGGFGETKTNSFSAGLSLNNLSSFTLGFRVLLSN